MSNLSLTALALTLAFSVHAQLSAEEAKLIEEIKRVDQAELAAVLATDVGALEKYWAEDLTVNAPNNQVLKGRKGALELVRNGILDYELFTREVEAVLPHGDTVIVMGLETVKPRGKAPFAGQTLQRRCTNIWMKRNGQWQLTARHASVIPQNPEPAGVAAGMADTRVVLPDDQRFARDDKNFLVETTIPGNFSTPEGIIAALLTLADQAADKKLSAPFTPKAISSTSGGKDARDLAAYYRGAKLSGKTMTVSFSGDAMRYLNSTVSIQQVVKGSIEETLRLHFPDVKVIEYEVDGKIVTDWDA